MRNFIKTQDIQERLNPRDSFYGGRTGASKLYYEAKEDNSISYVDFTSLYPDICKNARYPIGHPEIITDKFESIDKYFGIAKVKVLPPRGLYHPVLPYRSKGKLKFCLCRTCADNENLKVCRCSDEQRAIVGTWKFPPNAALAISIGTWQ